MSEKKQDMGLQTITNQPFNLPTNQPILYGCTALHTSPFDKIFLAEVDNTGTNSRPSGGCGGMGLIGVCGGFLGSWGVERGGYSIAHNESSLADDEQETTRPTSPNIEPRPRRIPTKTDWANHGKFSDGPMEPTRQCAFCILHFAFAFAFLHFCVCKDTVRCGLRYAVNTDSSRPESDILNESRSGKTGGAILAGPTGRLHRHDAFA